MKWIQAHFRRYLERRPMDFCWRIAVEGTVVALGVSILMGLVGIEPRKIELSFWPLLFAGVVVAPILETLIFQSFPVWIARLCKARFRVQVLASVIPFAIAHAMEGIQAGIAAGLVSGFYLAFTYVHWRERRRWTAFWTTALSHAIHNAIVIPLALALGEISL